MQDLFASLPAAQRFLEQAEDSLFQKQPHQALDNFIAAEQLLFEALFGTGAGEGEPDAQMFATYIYTLRKVGDVYSEIGDLQRGIAWYVETIRKNEKSVATDPKTFIYLHTKTGELQLLSGKPMEAKYSLTRAKHWAEKCSYQSTSIEVLEALLDLRENNIKRGLAVLLKLYTQATGTAYFTLFFRNQVLAYLARVDNLQVVKKARELAEADFAAAFAAADEARGKNELRQALRLYLLCLDKIRFLPENALPIEQVFATFVYVGQIISGLGFYRAAGEYFEECLHLRGMASVSSQLQVLCYYWHGRVFTKMKDYGNAFKTFENGLRLAKRHKALLLIFQLQYEIAIALAKSDKISEAQILLLQLASDLKQLPDGRDKDLAFASYNNELAFARSREYAWDKAMELYRESLARIQAHGCTSEYGRTIRGFGIAQLYAADADPAAAEKFLLESVQVFTQLQETDEKIESLKACADMYLRQGHIDQAMRHIDEAIARLEYSNDRDELALLCGMKANVFFLQEQFVSALLFYKKDLEIARTANNIRLLAVSFLNLGSVLQSQGNYPMAGQNLQQALKYFALINNPNLRITAHLGLALNHARLGEKAAADEQLRAAEQLWAQGQDKFLWAKLLIAKGTCNRLLGSSQAEVLLREGIQALKKIDSLHFDLLEAAYQLAGHCHEHGQPDECARVMQEAISQCRQMGLTAKAARYAGQLNAWQNKVETVAAADRPADVPAAPAGWLVKETALTVCAAALRLPPGAGPESIQPLLNALHRTAPAIIVRYGGILTHILGNQLLAVFNLRGNMPDHLVRAAGVALELAEKIGLALTPAGQAPACAIGIGLASGPGLASASGPTAESKFAVIGDFVGIATALAEAAEPGQVLISAGAVEQLAGSRTEFVRAITVAGQPQPVNAHRLLNLNK